VTDRISHDRIRAIDRIAPKAIVKGHGHRATNSLGHHVAKASAHCHHRVLTALSMTSIRCHKRHRPAVRQAIKTPCAGDGGG
jgi:hypothetical protein